MKFSSVTLQGNILTLDLLEQIAAGEAPKSAPRAYGFASAEALRNDIQLAWGEAARYYESFVKRLDQLPEGDNGTEVTRRHWVQPLLATLKYDTNHVKARNIDGQTYAISHEVVNRGSFPVHIVGANLSLDRKARNMRMSPHALLQEYLNRHESLYGLVTNGKFLRLLRDSSLLTRLSYVEFDLVRIFEESLYADFALLYRLLHVSRLPAEPADGPDAVLERYHQKGLESGSRIREKLSVAVEQGIQILANGLLREPANDALREWVDDTPTAAQEYYRQLLTFIYRLLFLMVTEERDLIFPKNDDDSDANTDLRRKRRIYYKYYSVGRLRRLAERPQLASERQYDLWESLLNTFALFEPQGYGQKLGISPLAGALFGREALGEIAESRIDNRVLLSSLAGLSRFENEQGGTTTVNYGSLDVEEFGSVYEGLLEYDPAIEANTFRFVRGNDRGSSGSHYTPDELVQPLIRHSLEHQVADRSVALTLPADRREAAARRLLRLSVCDAACGSGHILLAAARRIGLEVARLRSGEEQPNPVAVRRGVRDAIRHCIYGVDKNPLAVELCKVALWLEAHVPGEPLGFLDHRIRHGDAIVGLGRLEELQEGIATEAFRANAPEERELVNRLRKKNRAARKHRAAGGGLQGNLFGELGEVKNKVAAYRQRFAAFETMPEQTAAQILAKQHAFKALLKGRDYWEVRQLANLQVAQFFISKTDPQRLVTDEDFSHYLTGYKNPMGQAIGAAEKQAGEHHFFHWFLEFPEVFAEGGFDCVLGNPPFLGGQKISTFTSKAYLNFVHHNYAPAKGTTDLVAYFFRRAYDSLKQNGFLSLISTNTIAQGDTRVGGLATIREHGGTINHAVRSMRWPGEAAVEVALVSVFKGTWNGRFVLDGEEVEKITTYLDDQDFIGDPYKLAQNADKSFVGSYVLGKGFVLEPEAAQRLIERDARNRDVLFPYLNGKDLNSRPDQSPSRWVINFFDWPERRCTDEEWAELEGSRRAEIRERIAEGKVVELAPPNYPKAVAADYPDCYEILLREVKPERQRWKTDKDGKEIEGEYAVRKQRRIYWWQYGERTPALYRAIAGMERVLVVPLVSKYTTFKTVDAGIVFMHKLGIFTETAFGILSSSLHHEWAWKYSSTLGGSTLNYSPTDCYETFPHPPYKIEYTEKFEREYETFLDDSTLSLQLGLTKLYNQVHNPTLEADLDACFDGDTLTVTPAVLKKRSKATYELWRHLEKTGGGPGMGEAVERIVRLRALHRQLDEAVLAAYGWHIYTRWGPAIRLRHDFHEVDYLPEKDNVRYTIHREARREVLRRLLLLNHELHAAELRGLAYEVIDGEKVVARMRQQVEAWFPYTGRLHRKTVKFLCSGEDLLPNLAKSVARSYKPFVTQYASAFENELLERIFVPFDAGFQRQFPVDDGRREAYLKEQTAIDPSKLGKFCRMLKQQNTKYTLGDMHYLLNLVYKPTGSTLGKSTLLQDFRAFVLSVYGEAVLDKAYLQRIDALVKTYRNAAAHTGEITKAEAEACRAKVQELMGVLAEAVRTPAG